MNYTFKFLNKDLSEADQAHENLDDHARNNSVDYIVNKKPDKHAPSNQKPCGTTKRPILCACVVLILIFISVLVVLFLQLRNCEDDLVRMSENTNVCVYSDEATRVGIRKFLDKVRDVYFEMFPEDIAWHPYSTLDMVREKFQVPDLKPESIKRISERAESLLKEAIALNPDVEKLKPREHKSYLQILHFLQSNFGKPSTIYKSGLWLLGPSSFCQESICSLDNTISNNIKAPTNRTHIDRMLYHFKQINQSVHDYMEVLKLGIRKGMVRTRGECVAGFDALNSLHMNISMNGAKGIEGEVYARKFYTADFYSGISSELNDEYVASTGMNASEYIKKSVLEYIGTPIHLLLTYLKTDYYGACRPDTKGPGGLSALPIDVIYSNGSVVAGSKTDPYLPLCNHGNCRLNGSEAYKLIIDYFTTKKIHPLEVHQMGWDNVHKIFPKMVDIAKRVTKINDEKEAIKVFRKRLTDRKYSYFNEEEIPKNETSGEAYTKCISDDTAKKYCPKRWEAMMKWFRFAQMAMSIHEGNTIDFFSHTGKWKTTPSCPVKLRADYNPSSAAQSYWESNFNCTRPSYYYIPFWLDNIGPKYSEYTINAHEARPGHHTQAQGMVEHFTVNCEGPERFLQEFTYYTAFTEGWALYAENPLVAMETDVYEDNLMQKYGMLKWQMWRAMRLIVDTGLHYKGYSRDKSRDLFDKYAWDNTDIGRKEITRYQSNPGQATAYMIGQLDIWRLRNHTMEKLQGMFDLKEFHLQTLSQGASPLAFLESHINKYIDCKVNQTQPFCDIILNPLTTSTGKGVLYKRRYDHTQTESPRRRIRSYL